MNFEDWYLWDHIPQHELKPQDWPVDYDANYEWIIDYYENFHPIWDDTLNWIVMLPETYDY